MPVCSPVASRYDARVADVLPAKCISWSLDPQMTEDLDDKVVFCQMAADAGLTVPKYPSIIKEVLLKPYVGRPFGSLNHMSAATPGPV